MAYSSGKPNQARIAEVMAALKARGNIKFQSPANANEADRASIKQEREAVDLGSKIDDAAAHLLSIEVERSNLIDARLSADDASLSEVSGFTHKDGEKGHAAALTLATNANEEPASSLGSSTGEEEEVYKGCADDDTDPATEVADFYEIKTDLFDNINDGKKNTRFRAKLSIRAKPTTSSVNANILMLDFYNRDRDINKRLKEMEVDQDPWYLQFKAEFTTYAKMLVNFEIEPRLAVLKELTPSETKKKDSEIVGYAAGIVFQIRNQEPTVILYYGASKYELVLDFEFKRTPGSPCFKKGIYRDVERQHLDVELERAKPKFKTKRMSDFS